jgi:NADH dehydrogenase
MSTRRVLVLGGSGFVGRHVCEQLARLGWHITVPTRRAVNAASVQSLPGLTVIEASVHNEADLARLMPGHDAVVNLVAVLHGSEERFENVHVDLPGKIASAMKKRACSAWCMSAPWALTRKAPRCTSAARRAERRFCTTRGCS